MRASRLVAMLLLLQARGQMTAAELAGELEVSVRTIQLPTEISQEISAAAGRFHLDARGWFTARTRAPHLEALAAGVFGDLAVEAPAASGWSRSAWC